MVEHGRSAPAAPARTVMVGGSGFVGTAARRWLEGQGAAVVSLGSADVDLMAPDAGDTLAGMLRPDDTLVLISAKAPVKNVAMLEDNIRMGRQVCDALTKQPVAHVLYVSSDAVYADSEKPMTEVTCAEPGSLHGVMHLARELMLAASVGETPLGILRPTLIYGPDDPHNGYGPNMYRRRLAKGEPIFLFGKGEERRDHIFVEDVGELLGRMALHESRGVLNAVSGTVTSFHEIADMVLTGFDNPPAIDYRPRSGPMPHNGYRAFDNSAIAAAFPDFLLTEIKEGIRICHERDPALAG